jgi:hypothetical protein
MENATMRRLAERSILLLSIAAIGCRPDETTAISEHAGLGSSDVIIAPGPGAADARAR